MRHPYPVSGRVAAIVTSALLGGGLVAGCGQGQQPPSGQTTSSPAAAASPAAPTASPAAAAAASPAAPAGGTQTAAAPAAGGGGADVQRGQQIFAQNCATCHGPGGKGDGPAAVALNPKPQDLTDNQWKYGGTPDQIYKTITNGSPGTAMVSWSSLPEQDRRALVAYVLSLSGK